MKIEHKELLFIGDDLLRIFASTTRSDYIDGSIACEDIIKEVEELNRSKNYALVVMNTFVYKKCSDLREFFNKRNILVVTIPSIPELKKVKKEDIEKYYEDIIRKYIGLKVRL